MREFAIGDIHGCSAAFAALLEAVKPERTDTIILLGDYIDRGPDSFGVIEMILDLSRKCTVIALTGNHEKMLLQSRSDPRMLSEWLMHGGRTTLDSYERRGYARGIHASPATHWGFLLEQTLDFSETEESIFVHAAVAPDLDLEEQPEFLLFWQPFMDPTIHKSGKRIICGHTSQSSGLPAVFNHGICIDTRAYGGGWLTCFETAKDTFIQCNNLGERRAFDLQTLISQEE